MTNKAGVSSLDLAFVHRPTHISERTFVLAYWHAPLSYQYTVCACFLCIREKWTKRPINFDPNGALCYCTTLYVDSQLATSAIEQHSLNIGLLLFPVYPGYKHGWSFVVPFKVHIPSTLPCVPCLPFRDMHMSTLLSSVHLKCLARCREKLSPRDASHTMSHLHTNLAFLCPR